MTAILFYLKHKDGTQLTYAGLSLFHAMCFTSNSSSTTSLFRAKNMANKWLKSYHLNRQQFVQITNINDVHAKLLIIKKLKY